MWNGYDDVGNGDAWVKVGEYVIPLIGIPMSATEEECDCCHDIKQLQSIELTGVQFCVSNVVLAFSLIVKPSTDN
jgi:hypothetical protein